MSSSPCIGRRVPPLNWYQDELLLETQKSVSRLKSEVQDFAGNITPYSNAYHRQMHLDEGFYSPIASDKLEHESWMMRSSSSSTPDIYYRNQTRDDNFLSTSKNNAAQKKIVDIIGQFETLLEELRAEDCGNC